MKGEKPFKIQPLVYDLAVTPAVVEVSALEDHVLFLRFENGEEGTLDVKPFLGFVVFRRLQDAAAFRRVRVAFATIEWDAGVDLDPAFVYEKTQRVAIPSLADGERGDGNGSSTVEP